MAALAALLSSVIVVGATYVNDTLFVDGGYVTGGPTAALPSCRMVNSGGAAAQTTAGGTDTTPVAGTTYVAEVYVPRNCAVTGVSVFNGTVASGNITVALYNASGALIAKSASTAMSGTTVMQNVPLTAAINILGPATYYLEQQIDNTTGRIRTWPVGAFGASSATGSYGTVPTTLTPPTTFTASVGPIGSLY